MLFQNKQIEVDVSLSHLELEIKEQKGVLTITILMHYDVHDDALVSIN